MAARRKTTGAKLNIPLCLACVLLCLTLFSIHLSGGVVARYTTTASSGDSARVIKFGDLTLTETVGDTQYIAPGVALEWNAAVSFDGSESATYVFVEVSGVSSATANAVTLFEDGPSWTVNTGEWNYLDTYKVYYLELAPNEELKEVALFGKSGVSTDVSSDLTAAEITALGEITPKFRASVVQSNGFDSVEAAWKSLQDNHS